MTVTVRPARIEDAPAMALVHVEAWRQTYRGLFPDSILDDPGFVARRERQWTSMIGDPSGRIRTAIAETSSGVVGVAASGASESPDAARQLYILYVLADHHGSGAGTELFEAVVGPDDDVILWVADPNPRAQAFYRKHGFEPDGPVKVEDGVREIRMRRTR